MTPWTPPVGMVPIEEPGPVIEIYGERGWSGTYKRQVGLVRATCMFAEGSILYMTPEYRPCTADGEWL